MQNNQSEQDIIHQQVYQEPEVLFTEEELKKNRKSRNIFNFSISIIASIFLILFTTVYTYSKVIDESNYFKNHNNVDVNMYIQESQVVVPNTNNWGNVREIIKYSFVPVVNTGGPLTYTVREVDAEYIYTTDGNKIVFSRTGSGTQNIKITVIGGQYTVYLNGKVENMPSNIVIAQNIISSMQSQIKGLLTWLDVDMTQFLSFTDSSNDEFYTFDQDVNFDGVAIPTKIIMDYKATYLEIDSQGKEEQVLELKAREDLMG